MCVMRHTSRTSEAKYLSLWLNNLLYQEFWAGPFHMVQQPLTMLGTAFPNRDWSIMNSFCISVFSRTVPAPLLFFVVLFFPLFSSWDGDTRLLKGNFAFSHVFFCLRSFRKIIIWKTFSVLFCFLSSSCMMKLSLVCPSDKCPSKKVYLISKAWQQSLLWLLHIKLFCNYLPQKWSHKEFLLLWAFSQWHFVWSREDVKKKTLEMDWWMKSDLFTEF